MDEQRAEAARGSTRSSWPSASGAASSYAVEDPLARRAEEPQHREVDLAMAAVGGGVDQPGAPVRAGEDVAAHRSPWRRAGGSSGPASSSIRSQTDSTASRSPAERLPASWARRASGVEHLLRVERGQLSDSASSSSARPMRRTPSGAPGGSEPMTPRRVHASRRARGRALRRPRPRGGQSRSARARANPDRLRRRAPREPGSRPPRPANAGPPPPSRSPRAGRRGATFGTRSPVDGGDVLDERLARALDDLDDLCESVLAAVVGIRHVELAVRV